MKRANPDEEAIENGVTHTYSDRMRSLLEDPADVRKEMVEEIERRIDQAWKTWQSLPQALIFEVFIRQVQRKSGNTKILCGVSLDVARYFIENKLHISSMLFDFEKIPYFTFESDKSKFILDHINEFHQEFTVEDGPENKRQTPKINEEAWKEYGFLETIKKELKNVDNVVAKATAKEPKLKSKSLDDALQKKFNK